MLEALFAEMRRDDTVVVMGEDVGAAGGVFKQTEGLFEEFGAERVIDTPISESGAFGMAVGAAMTGLRPVFEVMFGDFITLVMDQLVNQAAKIHYMSAGQFRVPLVLRTAVGVGANLGPQHSQSLHAWAAHVPGLKVVMPSTPADAKGLMAAAIRDDNPVVFFEDRMLYNHARRRAGRRAPWCRSASADVKRAGSDVTIVAVSRMVQVALAAAELLAQRGHRGRGRRSAQPGAARPRRRWCFGQEDLARAGGRRRPSPVRRHRRDRRRLSPRRRSTGSTRRCCGSAARTCRSRSAGRWKCWPCRTRHASQPPPPPLCSDADSRPAEPRLASIGQGVKGKGHET